MNFPLGSAGIVAIRLVDHDGVEQILGIRASDAEVVTVLRNRLAPLVVDHPEVFANISIRVGGRRGHLRDAHLVYRRGFQTMRTFSLDAALDAAIGLVHTFSSTPVGTTPMHARTLVRGDSAILVSDNFSHVIDARSRQLSAAGFTIGSHAPVLVDSATGEALIPTGDDISAPTMSRVPISHVVVFAPDAAATVSPAVRLTHITMLVAGRDGPTRGDDLHALVELTTTVPVVRLDVLEPRNVARAIIQL